MKTQKITQIAFLFSLLSVLSVEAGTVTISATGLSSAPIFVTSSLSSLAANTQLYIGTFKNVSDLNGIISTYKAGVSGTSSGDASAKAATLYTSTFNWLTSSANFYNFVSSANSITQTAGIAGQVAFTTSATRTVNGVAASYAGASGTMDVTYANYGGGLGAPLFAFYGTGSEIALVTDSTWIVPANNASGVTIGTAQLASSGSGVASELLLANYIDYATGSDLISSVAIAQTVIPEPSSASLLALGVAGLVAMRARRKS
jgi:hypothetical protein